MKLILAEKPSVAKDIAAAFSGASRKNGYYEANDTIITWGLGHLVELKEPQDYNPELKSWNVASLPILPETFGYKPIPKSQKQLQVIKKLIRENKPSAIVLATDADREGELLGRLILQAAGYKGTVRRFWTSEALTPDVVNKTLKNLKDGKEYDNLYQEALARQHADWLIGINETRAMTATSPGRKLLSIGRVQTAVLGVLAQREEAIRNFSPEDFWTLQAVFSAIPFDLIDNHALAGVPSIGEDPNPDEEDRAPKSKDARFRFKRRDDALAVEHAVRAASQGKVLSSTTKQVQETPPQLFCLSDLQKEANKLYSMSAADTLAAAQTLYEAHKMISYPRTSCRHMACSNIELVQKSLAMLGFNTIDPEKAGGSRVFNDKKVAEAGHHALIPLRKAPADGQPIKEREKKIFDLIAARFIAAFMPPHVYTQTDMLVECAAYHFKATARQTVMPGWREHYPPGGGGLYGDTGVQAIKTGAILPVDSTEIKEGKTSPPPRFTEASLISLMQNAWRYVNDPDIRHALKEAKGIGTEATRASIIETLKGRNYVIMKGKTFMVTDLGMSVAQAVRKMGLAVGDLGFTGLWEKRLSEIGEGKQSYQEFVGDMRRLVIDEIDKIKHVVLPTAQQAKEDLPCPLCQAPMRMNAGGAFCSGCDLKVWRKIAGKQLTDAQLRRLIITGSVAVRGFTSKAGKKFDANVVLDRDHRKTVFDFTPKSAQSGS